MSTVSPMRPPLRVEDMGAGESTRGISVGRLGETRRSPQISQELREGWFRNVHLGHANVASLLSPFMGGARVVLELMTNSAPPGYRVDSDDSGVGDRGGCWKELSRTEAGGRIPHAKQGGMELAAVIWGV